MTLFETDVWNTDYYSVHVEHLIGLFKSMVQELLSDAAEVL